MTTLRIERMARAAHIRRFRALSAKVSKGAARVACALAFAMVALPAAHGVLAIGSLVLFAVGVVAER